MYTKNLCFTNSLLPTITPNPNVRTNPSKVVPLVVSTLLPTCWPGVVVPPMLLTGLTRGKDTYDRIKEILAFVLILAVCTIGNIIPLMCKYLIGLDYINMCTALHWTCECESRTWQ